MFVTVSLFIISGVALLAFRDRIKYPFFSRREERRRVAIASEKILHGLWEEAKEELEPFIIAKKAGKEVSLLYIRAIREIDENEKAIEEAKKAILRFPDELKFKIEEGKAYLALGLPEDALKAFQASFPILKNESDLLSYSQALVLSEYPEKALELLEPFFQKSQNGKLFFVVGEAFSLLKKWNEAVLAYARAQELGYDSRQLQLEMATALKRLGKVPESELLFRKILKRDPSDVLATIGLGNCMQAKGEHLRALSLFRSSKAWEKKDPLLALQAGVLALYLQRDHFAEECFSVALHREMSSEILFYWGYSLQRQRKWAEAECAYLNLVERYPDDQRGMEALLWLFAVGLSTSLAAPRAREMAEKLHQMKQDPPSLELLSAIEARIGNFSRALEIQEKLSSYDRDAKEIARRRQCLKTLRRNLPLDDHLLRKKVA